MELNKKLAEIIINLCSSRGETEAFVKELNHVASHIADHIEVGSIFHFLVFIEEANNMIADSFTEIEENYNKLNLRVKELEQKEKALAAITHTKANI